MASKKWQPLIDAFRSFLPLLRALTRNAGTSGEATELWSKLDDFVQSFPGDISGDLDTELTAANEGDNTDGPVAPLPPQEALESVMSALEERLDALIERAEELSNSDEDEDGGADEGDASEEGDEEAAPDEPAAPQVFGETSEGKGQTYRGDIRAIAGVGDTLAFVTVHPEGVPTALYWLNADKLTLQQDALPCGGTAVAADGNTVYVGGTDRVLYECGKKVERRAGPFANPIAAIAVLSKKRLAVLHGKQIDVVSDKDGAVLQTLELPEDGTCLSTDKSRSWLVAGGAKGSIATFDGQDSDEFAPGEVAKVHDGAVTVVAFEPEELRFFSAGADNKLYTTFARGSLEPEDKGRGNMHEDVLTALALGPGDRIITGSRDATLKNWPRAGAVKPSTLKDVVGRVVGLTVVAVYNQPHLAVACDDNTIRFLRLEKDGRFPDDDVVHAKVTGAADWIRNELAQTYDPRRREKALKVLAEWKDSASIDILGTQLSRDPDHQIRKTVAELLVASDSPRVIKILEKAVGHPDAKVRLIAFKGLNERAKADLGPMDLAFQTGHADVGVEAVKALEPLAKRDDQALTRLVDALDAGAWDVRKAALAALEAVYGAAPTASLTALGSKYGDIRTLALKRVFERRLLDDSAVQSAIRRRLEDDDGGVRKVAFLLSVLSKPDLALVLRAGDAELHRQLNELEKPEKGEKDKDKADKAEKEKAGGGSGEPAGGGPTKKTRRSRSRRRGRRRNSPTPTTTRSSRRPQAGRSIRAFAARGGWRSSATRGRSGCCCN